MFENATEKTKYQRINKFVKSGLNIYVSTLIALCSGKPSHRAAYVFLCAYIRLKQMTKNRTIYILYIYEAYS